MTKAVFIANLATHSGCTKKDTEAVFNAFVIYVTAGLQTGQDVILHGIGKFTVKTTAARKGRNPITGVKIDIPAKKKVAFKCAKVLKDAVQT